MQVRGNNKTEGIIALVVNARVIEPMGYLEKLGPLFAMLSGLCNDRFLSLWRHDSRHMRPHAVPLQSVRESGARGLQCVAGLPVDFMVLAVAHQPGL